MRVGRWFCLLLAVVTVLWLPVIDLLSEQAPISLDLPRSPYISLDLPRSP